MRAMSVLRSARHLTSLRRFYRRGRRANRLSLTVILIVAALLRAQYLLQIEHNTDHAWPIAQALRTLDYGDLPLVGQGTSVLFASPPLTGYLYLPWLALTRSPLGAYVFVIALNTLAVLLAYRAARTLIGPRRALIAAGLMAVNPWVIEYSRTTWVQSLLPFLVTATAWLLWPVLLGRSRRPVRRTVLALVMLTLTGQTYLLGFLLVLPVGLLILVFRRRVPPRGLLIGGAVFAIALAIYGTGLLGDWATVQQRVQGFGAEPAQVRTDAWNHAVRLVTGADYAAARGVEAPAGDAIQRQDLGAIVHWLLLGVLGFGIAAAVYSALRPASDPARHNGRGPALIALVWFLLPVLLMTYVGQAVHPFYLLLSLPAGHVLAAWGLGVIFQPERRPGGPILALLGIPLAVLMGLNSARYAQETAALPGAHGLTALSLEYGLPLGRAVRENLPPDGVVQVGVEGWIVQSLAGQTFPVLAETRAPRFTLIPREGGVLVDAYAPDEALPEVAGAELALRLGLPDGWTLAVEAFPAGAAARCAVDAEQPIQPGLVALGYTSDQGIELRAAALDGADGAWVLTTIWAVTGQVEGIEARLFAPFAHVFDSAGARVLIVDGEAVPGYDWRAGDCHVHRMAFSLPEGGAGPYTLQVGQYDAIAGLNAIFLDPDSGESTPLVALPLSLP